MLESENPTNSAAAAAGETNIMLKCVNTRDPFIIYLYVDSGVSRPFFATFSSTAIPKT